MYCKHCGKEIDDNSTFCQNCGGAASEREAVRTVPIKNKKTPLIVGVALVFVILVGAFGLIAKQSADRKQAEEEALAASIAESEAIAYAEQQEKEKARSRYIDALKDFAELSAEGFETSQEICNFVFMVWYDTVFEQYREETAAYTMVDGVFHDSFDDMMDALAQSNELYTLIADLDSNKSKVAAAFQMLSNPDDDFVQIYNVAEDMLDAYTALYTHWNMPSGDIYTYSDKYDEISKHFAENYEKFILLIPENEND